MALLGDILTAFGGTAILAAFTGWLARVFASHLIEADRARHAADLESLRQDLRLYAKKRTHVHQLQFETEFRAYQEIWSALDEACAATMRLRPMLSYVDPMRSKDEQQQDKIDTFVTKFTAFYAAVRRNYPFLPDAITSEIDELMSALHNEGLEFESGRAEDDKISDWFRRARETEKQVTERSRTIRKAIQQRIGLMEIVG